eukprot:gb/GEZJ01006189.1/.p2 GENE.gb/GEZJ01006189.1/~~gb/GEZJ01006189.1/.p2  ORF type:complete len:141 (+),score=13.42 gb/GEZJ01006189.1/:422-844(+)
MHRRLFEWIQHLISHCTGLHPNCDLSNHAFILSENLIQRINDSQKSAYKEVPSVCSRLRASFLYIKGFKAKNYMKFSVYFGPVMFNGSSVSESLTKLWSLSSKIPYVLFDTVPKRKTYIIRSICGRAPLSVYQIDLLKIV